jgi:hypothetical protein
VPAPRTKVPAHALMCWCRLRYFPVARIVRRTSGSSRRRPRLLSWSFGGLGHSTVMDENVERLGQLLFRGDRQALDDLRSALGNWLPFYQKHGQSIGVDVPWLKKIWSDGPRPWDVLIDIGVLHRFVFEADHAEFFDQIVAGVSELGPAKSLKIDWETLAATDAEVEIDEFFAALASQAKQGNEVLVILDKGSDSYPLAFLPPDSVAKAQKLVGLVGDGEVVAAGEG